MLDSFWLSMSVGILLGTLAGLGVGGGSLLILWLTVVLGIPAPEARVINLLFFIPAALISSILRRKQGILTTAMILPAILAGSIGAIIFSRLSTFLDETMLKRLFGILLLFTGLRELFYRPRKAR